jgi:hypothetical protein
MFVVKPSVLILSVIMLSVMAPSKVVLLYPGSAKTNGRQPEICLGRVFNINLDSFKTTLMCHMHIVTSKVENSAPALSR